MSEICYLYFPDTGEYLSETYGMESPLEPGVILWPAHTTPVPPPVVAKGYRPIWSNGSWTTIVDHRGETWFKANGERVEIDTLGDPTEFETPLQPAAPPPEPVDIKTYAKYGRDKHEFGGITVGGVAIATDDRSKTLIQGARRRVELDPSATTSWAAADGNIYVLTAAQIIAVSDAVADHVAITFEGYAKVMAGLADGTIKTEAQVDAVYAALKTAF